jgi:quercetin dioxygenase-like cupin family protein
VKIEYWNPGVEGVMTEEGLRRKLEARGYRVERHVYPPGTVFPAHTHPVDKMDGVVSGRFRMVVEGEEMILESGDCIGVPAGVEHGAEVLGDEPVISLDATRD